VSKSVDKSDPKEQKPRQLKYMMWILQHMCMSPYACALLHGSHKNQSWHTYESGTSHVTHVWICHKSHKLIDHLWI